MACWRPDNDGRRRDDCARQLQTCARGPPAGDLRAGTPTDHQDDRARGLLVRRHLVDRVRDAGDPARRRGRRRRASPSGSRSSCRSRSSSRCCSRSSSRRTARRSSRIRAAAVRTSSAARTSATTPAHGRRRVAARRLHPHGRGVGVRGCARDHVDSRSCTALTNERVLLCLARDRVDHASRTCAASRSRAASSRCPRTSTSSCSARLIVCGLAHEFGLFGLHPFPTISFVDVTKDLTPAQVATRRRTWRSAPRRSARSGCSGCCAGFSSGAVALTGVEAISNGVPAFQRPESKNAAITLDLDGRDPRHAVPRRVGAGAPPAADPARDR